MPPRLAGGAQLQTYSPRLNQITRNVRWTLDLDIIQQQTVEGLGDLFQADRCLICTVPAAPSALVAVEYLAARLAPVARATPSPQRTGAGLERAAQYAGASSTPLARRAAQMAAEGEPVEWESGVGVAVATRYQNQINGFIVLYDRNGRPWTGVELNLITDLADQVGTAIAHAQRFAESHALAIKLQQANASLLEKQREFQEARRQAEEARQQAEEASRLKSEFLANTSHELRTPLNGIIGFLKLVLDGMADDPAEQEEFIEEAHKSAIHLLELINDVLDIAKIEAGKMQIDMGPVNLKELLADVENFARPLAEQKGL
jgi:signal transduction histidine kinase